MRTVPVTVDLSDQPLDENLLRWDHSVTILAARAYLEYDLAGESPAWVRVTGPCGGVGFVWYPPAAAGSRRVAAPGIALPLHLPAHVPLKVWGVRDGGGGVFRVELDFERARSLAPDAPGPDSGAFGGRGGRLPGVREFQA